MSNFYQGLVLSFLNYDIKYTFNHIKTVAFDQIYEHEIYTGLKNIKIGSYFSFIHLVDREVTQ